MYTFFKLTSFDFKLTDKIEYLQAECYFDCQILVLGVATSFRLPRYAIPNLECLQDCFENNTVTNGEKSDHCVNALISDVMNNGICYAQNGTSDKCNNDMTPACPPLFEGVYPINYSLMCRDLFFGYATSSCSKITENLLRGEDCLKDITKQQSFIRDTLVQLVEFSCVRDVLNGVSSFPIDGGNKFPFVTRGQTNAWQDQLPRHDDVYFPVKTANNSYRLPPLQSIYVFDNFTLKTDLNFTHTRNRYPWVCSLRRKGPSLSPEHLCAVTLLAVPPQPTIVVGAAHCTYLCKDKQENHRPSCCCIPGAVNCEDDLDKCGQQPEVYPMNMGRVKK